MLALLLISSDETQYVDAENAFREIGFRVARVKPHEAELSLSQQIFRVVVIAEDLFPREKTELANRAAQVSPSIILVCGSRADYSVPADGYVAASRGLAGILSEVEAVMAPTLYEISV